jgi:hypothetical protein
MTTKIEDAVRTLDGYFLHNHAADLDEVRNAYLVLKEATQQREAGAVAWVSVSDEIPAVMGWYIGYWQGRVEPLQWRGEYWHHTRPTRDVATPTHWCRLPPFALHPAQAASQEGEYSYCLNLLAAIHRDGGHYTNKHGVKKSTDDAIAKWYEAAHAAEFPAHPAADKVRGLIAGLPRAVELAERLTMPGDKAAHVSASELHEVADFIDAVQAALSPPANGENDGL